MHSAAIVALLRGGKSGSRIGNGLSNYRRTPGNYRLRALFQCNPVRISLYMFRVRLAYFLGICEYRRVEAGPTWVAYGTEG